MGRPFLLLFVLSIWGPLVLAHAQISLPEEDGGGDDPRRRPQIYIVHVEKPKNLLLRSAREREDWHKSFLPSLALDSGEPRLVYSYQHAIGGFAARLTPEEAEAMEAADGVLSVQPDAELKTKTTHSHRFLGLTRSGQLWETSNRGEGMIIGVIEPGFNTKHYSFRGDDLMPPPPRWKGKCEFLPHRCNNRVIGNKIFNATGYFDPDGDYSHGTHVASTAAGATMTGVSFKGGACGSASGAAPRAHLALYSVNNQPGFPDFLMAVDTAIEDGVDVLSVSMGLVKVVPYYSSNVDIALLAATKHGVFVSMAAGNNGPGRGTIQDGTPWTLSVGASTLDREIRVEIELGKGGMVYGETINAIHEFFPVGGSLPVVFPGNLTGDSDVAHCNKPDFGGVDVSGKVVLCLQGHITSSRTDADTKSCNVQTAGGKMMILLNEKVPGSIILYGLGCGYHGIPVVNVEHREARILTNYVASDPNPTLSFEPIGTITGHYGHPVVADFSARGPSPVDSSILQPDILGPGVNVLAAFPWSPESFFFQSGTSMACPHLSGIAAMLRSLHPTWSPAMIKSAIMTTADWQDNAGMPIADHTGKPASLHAMGAGQVNATRAVDPGLVYDIQYCDYVKYVCGLNYTQEDVEIVVRKPVNCRDTGAISGEELNYPSFSVEATFNFKTITRTLMNVGRPRETYILSLNEPREVMIDVFPRTLNFSYFRQNLTYTVTIIAMTSNPDGTAEGQLTWVSTYHRVRSPIAITFA